MSTLSRIPGPSCCADLPPEEAIIGVTITHLDGSGDGSAHMLDLYWQQVPEGRRTVKMVTFEPLTLEGQQDCYCGWSGSVINGEVV